MSGQQVRNQERRVAVVGSGVAGLSAAHVLGREARVTLFEADSRLGGHADTHVVDRIAVDTGFIVHNERTYPHLMRLFKELVVVFFLCRFFLSLLFLMMRPPCVGWPPFKHRVGLTLLP